MIICPLLMAYYVYNKYDGAHGNYSCSSTVYTGVIGSSLSGNRNDSKRQRQNLLKIMSAKSTLKRVSFRLFARVMIFGSPDKDTKVCSAASYNDIYNRCKWHKDLLAVIDKNSETQTVKNLYRYERQDKNNFVYGLFNYFHPHYSYNALKRIVITPIVGTDLVDLSYENNDAAIVYNTLEILLEEFVNEYKEIRYGETDNVIQFFYGEFSRVAQELAVAEDSLTTYQVRNKIINYGEETRQMAILNSSMNMTRMNNTIDIETANSKILLLETQMAGKLDQIKSNREFIQLLTESSNLSSKVSQLEPFSQSRSDIKGINKDSIKLDLYKQKLLSTNKKLYNLTHDLAHSQHTKQGIAQESLISEWLSTKLQLLAAKEARKSIDFKIDSIEHQYIRFAPIGSTLNRKNRSISFKESNYMEFLGAYNAAILRKKNLEMTAATIRVLNPPALPLTPESIGRKNLVVTTFIITLFIVIAFFFLIEILDRTLRDVIRTKRLTGLDIICAFPGNANFRKRKYNESCREIAAKQLSTHILQFFNHRKANSPYIIGLLSTEQEDGKSTIAEYLSTYWERLGIKVKHLNWENDFNALSKEYLLAEKLEDIYETRDENILIIEHPNISQYNIRNQLLSISNVNLFVARATRAWKNTDDLYMNELKELNGSTPLLAILNKTHRSETEQFTGMLPPFSWFNRIIYRFSQLGLTASEQNEKEMKTNIEEQTQTEDTPIEDDNSSNKENDLT